MFFSKFIVPAVAVLSAAAGVFASPVQPAAELVARGSGTDVYNTCKHVYDTCEPVIAGLAVAVDVAAEVDVIANVFAAAQVELAAYVDVDVVAELDAIVDINVNLLVALIVALSKCNILDVSIFAKVDAFISAYLAVLAKINADICVHIGNGIPLLNLNLFLTLKLILTVKVLGLVNLLL
ncbi:hypothetical protein EIP91_000251 [Steccherinum ochraceum]|uniref:Uncharacterized protein n=1 Tax=Steccherinum ochraceum TaxID=92696 RepID=A0A4R0RG35_9APHY|nr:hypothetical protein EIP91_000251 [Steccherinum ochraceum]